MVLAAVFYLLTSILNFYMYTQRHRMTISDKDMKKEKRNMEKSLAANQNYEIYNDECLTTWM